MKELENKVAIVTGGTSGIGRAAAVALAEAGAKLMIAGRREVEGNETVKLAQNCGGEAAFLRVDVTKEDEISDLVKETVN